MFFDLNTLAIVSPLYTSFLHLWSSHLPQTTVSHREILTPEVRGLVEQIYLESNIKGLAVAVVHPGSQHEYSEWGQATESGNEVTEHVCLFSLTIISDFISHV
jgi:hypothetical protein